MADAAKTAETTAETVKKTVNKAQAQGAQAFRENVDKSIAGLTELNAQGKRNLEAVIESSTAATRGAEALATESLAYGKKSWEEGVNAAQSMAQARSVQELIELQTNFAKSAMEAYIAQTTRASEIVQESVKNSFKPINERVTASVEKFQAAR